jgi:hypothetical protein
VTSADGLYQVYTDLGQPICAGLVVENGRVVHCAPIVRRKFLGTDIHHVYSWLAASLGVWKITKVGP